MTRTGGGGGRGSVGKAGFGKAVVTGVDLEALADETLARFGEDVLEANSQMLQELKHRY